MKHYLFLFICIGMFTLPSFASTVKVERNTSSGIQNTEYTYKQSDGTVLGFYLGWEVAYFTGAISSKSSITIPDNVQYDSKSYPVKYIGRNLCDFEKASTVTSLTLPTTAESINDLPSCVKILHTNSFIQYINHEYASNLDKVLVPSEHLQSYYDETDWSNYVLINAEGTNPSKITINMTKEGEFAQLLLQKTDNWYKVNELTVVGNLNENDLNVFKRMRQLTKLDLSKAIITDIPNQFDGATHYYEYRDGFNLLEELSLPDINSIGDYAFAQCYRLKSIKMSKVNTIGSGTFSCCGASQITLPEGVSSIGRYAFYRSNLTSIEIPSSITEISNYCFQYCSALKTITIPSSVTTIGYESFEGSGLTSVSLPGVKTIGSRAFYNCKQLSTIQFSEGLISFDDQPFYGCTSLTEIDLPSTFRSMTYSAFYGCTNVKKVISRAVTPPTHNNSYSILDGCDKTDVKLYVPAMSIDKYRAESGWKTFYTILPMEDKTTNIHIYDYATIDDASQFTNDCDMTLNWIQQNRNGSNQYYCGALDYNGSSTLSMHDYKQYHYMGRSSSNNPYSYDAHFTSLISNGTMRSDNVQTTLRVYDTNTWYFISLPYDVKVSDITYTDGTQFAIRKYSGQNRASQAGSTWVNLSADDTMNAYEGYILRCNKQNADFTFPAINNTNKNKVFEKESVVMPLGEYLSEFEHNRSWNLIGNPYPCFYDTRRMDFTAPITVWNRYNKRYDAYSPLDDSYILHPAQSFFVQRPVDQKSITFDKAGRQKNATVQTFETKATSRKASSKSTRKIFNVIMSNGTIEDHTRFVINSEAACAYELDKDASKFIVDDNTTMLLYTVEDGVKYAINERPMENGIINLGFYVPADGDFTISFNSVEDESLVLIDHETNTETELIGEYHFTAKAGFNDGRFTLMFGETTSISNINVNEGCVSANAPYSIYTIDGRLVGNYVEGNSTKLSKGIYVINSKDVNHKIVVK